jgi:hypothetical protein
VQGIVRRLRRLADVIATLSAATQRSARQKFSTFVSTSRKSKPQNNELGGTTKRKTFVNTFVSTFVSGGLSYRVSYNELLGLIELQK